MNTGKVFLGGGVFKIYDKMLPSFKTSILHNLMSDTFKNKVHIEKRVYSVSVFQISPTLITERTMTFLRVMS